MTGYSETDALPQVADVIVSEAPRQDLVSHHIPRPTWQSFSCGSPIAQGNLCCMGCTVVATHVAGDQTIVVGKVEDAEINGGEPLLFFGGEYRHIARQ